MRKAVITRHVAVSEGLAARSTTVSRPRGKRALAELARGAAPRPLQQPAADPREAPQVPRRAEFNRD
jgi:hypothetical protein